ncbi:MAG: hypothetical protein Q9166_002419 [cf. Caloplaca sp. 2 TL-2023]
MPPTLVASQHFAKPNLPRHSNNGTKRSRASSVHSPSVRLSIIEEDAASAPPMPPRAHHRPFHRRWNLGDPPRSSFESPPPKYSVWDTMGPKGEKLADLILILSNPPESAQPAEDSLSSSPAPFPAGSYTLTTYLSTVQTDCTSKPSDWSCYPYHTYAESPSEALANFTWVITHSSNDNFAISSTDNPWSVNFDSTPLTKVDVGTENERYRFSTELNKITIPIIGVNCYFNGTTLEGNLYTTKARNYPFSSDTMNTTSSTAPAKLTPASSNNFQPWPYAIDIRQSVGGGQNVPQCFRLDRNNQPGDRITEGIIPRPESSECSCEYKNFDS